MKLAFDRSKGCTYDGRLFFSRRHAGVQQRLLQTSARISRARWRLHLNNARFVP
jgi:hypothetical protein